MSILSTVKKGYLYMKTSTGYLKLLPRTLASLVSLDNGNSVETEIASIKSAASSLSTTVSGHTTKLNGLKNGSTSTVANNLTTTASGYVLDARQGKTLNDSITSLNSTLIRKIAYSATVTNETMLGKTVYSISVWKQLPSNSIGTYSDVGLPSNMDYAWIDQANSYICKNDYTESFPVPYVNPRDNSWRNCVGVKINEKNKLVVFTSNDWSGYGIFVTIKYVLK